MEALGLPLAFGKQAALPPKPPLPQQQQQQQQQPSAGPSRGAHAGRAKGAGNKRGRGGGRGGAGAVGRDDGWNQRAQHVAEYGSGSGSSQQGGFQPPLNSGTKRPHPTSPGDTVDPNNSNRGRGGGARGRGGGGRGGGGSRGGHPHSGGGERGFFKDSFCQDPWKELESRRAARAGAGQAT